ncbi:MAG: LPS biosynthesis protein WbpP [Planctomycetaceae bacterium]|nr:LPS biosynthesis protein WbpP [Planctomycetaceae bacterium]
MAGLCLVTGGAGFIGSHLVDALRAQGRQVRVLDEFSTGLLANIAPGVEVVEGSITNASVVEAAVAGCEVVFHLAALASVAKSVEDPPLSHAICATGTLNVLNAARKAGVRRVVYAGSASAYGGASDPAGQGEETPLVALSPYAAAKLAGEFYCQAFSATFGLETVRLRFFNVFGPRQRPDSPYSGVIAIFTAALTAGRTPTIHGDGLQSRDFVYVSDVANALIRGAETPGISGRVYNVGTGGSVTLLDLVRELNAILGTSAIPIHGPERQGDIRHSRAKIERIRAELGYSPRVAFAEGLRHTLEWYKTASH